MASNDSMPKGFFYPAENWREFVKHCFYIFLLIIQEEMIRCFFKDRVLLNSEYPKGRKPSYYILKVLRKNHLSAPQ